MTTYEIIKKRRKELNMTQDELAELTGYTSRSTVSKIEKGLIDVSLPKLRLFAKALHIDELDLMNYEHEPFELDPYEQELVETFRTLNSEGRFKVLEYVEDLSSSEKYKKRIDLEKEA